MKAKVDLVLEIDRLTRNLSVTKIKRAVFKIFYWVSSIFSNLYRSSFPS